MREPPCIDLKFRQSKLNPELKRTFSCEAFSAERVSIASPDPYEYSYKGGGDYLALHDIVRSDGESFVEGVSWEHVRDIRNRMTFIPADCTVSGWTAPIRRSNSFLAVYFDREAMAKQLGDAGRREHFAPAMYFEDAALLSTVSKIDGLLRQQPAPDTLYAETLGLLATIELCRLNNAWKSEKTDVVGGLSRPQMQRLIEYMHARLDQDLSLTELAAITGLSQFHFARLFKTTTGTTPHQYVLALRIRRARDLLSETKKPVWEVAAASGFKGAVQFNRAFSKITGATPSEYRKSFRPGGDCKEARG
jgi:AraC family transcriptional regulator